MARTFYLNTIPLNDNNNCLLNNWFVSELLTEYSTLPLNAGDLVTGLRFPSRNVTLLVYCFSSAARLNLMKVCQQGKDIDFNTSDYYHTDCVLDSIVFSNPSGYTVKDFSLATIVLRMKTPYFYHRAAKSSSSNEIYEEGVTESIGVVNGSRIEITNNNNQNPSASISIEFAQSVQTATFDIYVEDISVAKCTSSVSNTSTFHNTVSIPNYTYEVPNDSCTIVWAFSSLTYVELMNFNVPIDIQFVADLHSGTITVQDVHWKVYYIDLPNI